MICDNNKLENRLQTEERNTSHFTLLCYIGHCIQTMLRDDTSSLLIGQHMKPAQSEWINSYSTVLEVRPVVFIQRFRGLSSERQMLLPMNFTTGSISAFLDVWRYFPPAENVFCFAKARRAHKLKCGCQDSFICQLQYK